MGMSQCFLLQNLINYQLLFYLINYNGSFGVIKCSIFWKKFDSRVDW